jgi:hypothetical protein
MDDCGPATDDGGENVALRFGLLCLTADRFPYTHCPLHPESKTNPKLADPKTNGND